MTLRLEIKRVRQLQEAAEKLGYDVVHVHMDKIKLPGRVRVKLELWQREKRK
jgi:regulator of protease activity HflC (stomatin/prohibitin superfamily)